MKLGDTILVRKKLTPERFAANMMLMSAHPLQSPPVEFDEITINTEADLKKYRQMEAMEAVR